MADAAQWAELDVTLTFSDGRTEEVRLSLAARIAVERKWPGVTTDVDGKLVMRSAPGLESALFAAWFSLKKPGEGDTDEARFDDWSTSVVSLAEVASETVPSQPAPGDVE